MAKLAHIEARKAEAMRSTAESVADLHRKMDLIMAKLGIVDSVPQQPEAPAEVQPEGEQPEPEQPKAKSKK